jgi:hypothetical protein
MTKEIPAIEFYNLLGISHHNVNHQLPRSGLSHLEQHKSPITLEDRMFGEIVTPPNTNPKGKGGLRKAGRGGSPNLALDGAELLLERGALAHERREHGRGVRRRRGRGSRRGLVPAAPSSASRIHGHRPRV